MAQGYYNIPIIPYFGCPYMMRDRFDENIDSKDGALSGVKKLGDAVIPYDSSQYRILPLLAIPLLFAAAAGPRPILYGPFPPQPSYYYYWYYYR